jgi:uncharacterized protein with HEPN domain
MEKEIKAWLMDIKQAIVEIEQFLPAKREFLEFKKDLKARRAIEIIGEAVNGILSSRKDIAISNSRKIVDTRNRISHGYDSVSDDIIWAIII